MDELTDKNFSLHDTTERFRYGGSLPISLETLELYVDPVHTKNLGRRISSDVANMEFEAGAGEDLITNDQPIAEGSSRMPIPNATSQMKLV